MTTFVKHFILLFWKDIQVQRRMPCIRLLELMIPVTVIGSLALVHQLVLPEHCPALYFKAYKVYPITCSNCSIATMAYFPDSQLAKKIMEEVKKGLGADAIKAFPNKTSLQQFVKPRNTKKKTKGNIKKGHINCGIIFPKSLGKNINNDITYKLIFKEPRETLEEPFTFDEAVITTTTCEKKRRNKDYGKAHFVLNSIKAAVDLAIIDIIKSGTKPGPKLQKEIWLQQLPHPEVKVYPIYKSVQLSAFGNVLCFSLVILNISKELHKDKAFGIRESMKMLGVRTSLHWIAFFCVNILKIALIVISTGFVWTFSYGELTIIKESNPIIFFVFHLLYGIDCLLFGFLVSTFFKKGVFAAQLFFIGSYLVDLVYVRYFYKEMPIRQLFMLMMLHNVAMCRGFQLYLEHERQGVGISWNNINIPLAKSDPLTILYVLIMLGIDAVLYSVFTWYLSNVNPGPYSLPRPLRFPFMPSYWSGEKILWALDDEKEITNYTWDPEYFETSNKPLKSVIHIRGLRKVLHVREHEKNAVADVNLDIIEKQITVIYGPENSGKTTLLSLLLGLQLPTTGSVFIHGFNTKTHMDQIWKEIGICPQQNILFDSLTVKEHLIFYKQLEDYSKNPDVTAAIKILRLESKKDVLVQDLSQGIRRRLCVGITLMGNTKILFMDEPTSDMDHDAKMETWDMINQCRKNRTIVLTTHSMEEATYIGDRIAIMTKGTIQSCGSAHFLGRKYRLGYHLNIDKLQGCDTTRVHHIVQRTIPEASLIHESELSISYKLPRSEIRKFSKLFQELETRQDALLIYDMGATVTTVEDILTDVDRRTKRKSTGYSTTNYDLHLLRKPRNEPLEFNQGRTLGFQRLSALLVKRLLLSNRDWVLYIAAVAIPTLLVLAVSLRSKRMKEVSKVVTTADSEFKMEPSLYNKDLLFPYQINRTKMSIKSMTEKQQMVAIMSAYLSQLKYPIVDTASKRQSVSKYVTSLVTKHPVELITKCIFGTTFGKNYTISHYPFNCLHSSSVALGIATNTLMKQKHGINSHISTNYLPLSIEKQKQQKMKTSELFKDSLPFSLTIGLCLMSVLIIKEKTSSIKHASFTGGVTAYTYWLSHFICDFTLSICVTLIISFTVLIIKPGKFAENGGTLYVLLILVLYDWSIVPYTYILSFLYKKAALGYFYIVLYTEVIGSVGYVLYSGLSELDDLFIFVLEKFLFLISPSFTLKVCFQNFESYQEHLQHCMETSKKSCNKIIEKCTWECMPVSHPFSLFEPGIGQTLIALACQGFLHFSILINIESNWGKNCFGSIERCFSRFSPIHQSDMIDADVLAEEEKIITRPMNLLTDANELVLKNVKKYIRTVPALKGVSIGIPKGQTFGILGMKNSGKSTLFKVMAGELFLSLGDGYLRGKNYASSLSKARQNIGYCPQYDPIHGGLTCKEVLTMHANIKGIKQKQIPGAVATALGKHNLTEFDTLKVKSLSGSNRKKLSVAVALLGDPAIIFLDEPTVDVDPDTRRHLWDIILHIQEEGKTVVFTSESIEECEVLCNRLVILVDGEFKCLGSVQYLKYKFGKRCLLRIKLNNKDRDPDQLQEDILSVKSFIEDNFQRCILKEEYGEHLLFSISLMTTPRLPWSYMFHILEKEKSKLNIAEYTLSQTTLKNMLHSLSRIKTN